VLVVSSSEGMLYGVLRHTTHLGPAVTLHSVLVVGTSSLQHGLVSTSSTSDNTNLGTDFGGDSFLSSGWETKTGGALLLIVGDDNGEASRSTCKGTTITDLGLNVAHDGTLRHLLQRQHVANVERSLLSAVYELSGVHTFGGDHEFGVTLETVSIEELNLGNGCTSSGVVQDFLHDTTDVTAAFGVVDSSELDGPLSGPGVGLEDRGLTLSLRLSNTTDSFHESKWVCIIH